MPRFKDNRKSKQSVIFNGWTDPQEPNSPLNDLFSKLVPILQGMRRKRGVIQFPPMPPHPTLPSPDPECIVGSTGAPASANYGRPHITDFACDHRELEPVSAALVADLCSTVDHRETSRVPPIPIEHTLQFEETMLELSAACPFGDPLVVVDFYATWCGPCKAMAPIFRQLSLNIPAAHFMKVDVDECEELSRQFKISSMPTVKIMRGSKVLHTITGGGPQFMVEFLTTLDQVMNDQEKAMMQAALGAAGDADSHFAASMETRIDDIHALSTSPLAMLKSFTSKISREVAGLTPVDSECRWDVGYHEAAGAPVAQSMLNRMKADVKWWADKTNASSVFMLMDLDNATIEKFLCGDAAATTAAQAAVTQLSDIMVQLETMKAQDTAVVHSMIPLLVKVLACL